jgi:hypothetical protein
MAVKILIVISLVGTLLGCGQANQNTDRQLVVPDTTGAEQSNAATVESNTPQPTKTPTESGVTVAEISQLTTAQVQELMSLAEQSEQKQPGRKFRIIVPTYIPSGFQVDSLETDAKVGVGPPSYTIKYRDPNSGADFSIDGSSGGWGAGDYEHEDIKVFSEALGIVILAVTSSDRESNAISTQFRDAPIVVNGRGYFWGSSGISPQEAVKIVESLQYMDSPQSKARPLEEIRSDADKLIGKYDFPLESCGDPPTGANDHWYPVFIDGTFGRQAYCKDAVGVKNTFAKVQVASFTSYERALEFAKAVGGRVGQPDN